MQRVVFACRHNACRSQMAAAFFNRLADPDRAEAVSAGTEPAERVHPEVATVMADMGIDMSGATPQRLTTRARQRGRGSGHDGLWRGLPLRPGSRDPRWQLDDPKGRPLAEVRATRDDIHRRIRELVTECGWARRT